MKKNPKWFRHEALHTTHIAVSLISDQLCDHPYYTSGINPEYNLKVNDAIKALSDAYQLVGSDRTHEVKKHIKISQ